MARNDGFTEVGNALAQFGRVVQVDMFMSKDFMFCFLANLGFDNRRPMRALAYIYVIVVFTGYRFWQPTRTATRRCAFMEFGAILAERPMRVFRLNTCACFDSLRPLKAKAEKSMPTPGCRRSEAFNSSQDNRPQLYAGSVRLRTPRR